MEFLSYERQNSYLMTLIFFVVGQDFYFARRADKFFCGLAPVREDGLLGVLKILNESLEKRKADK